MGTKEDYLFDNPLGVVFAFFAFLVTAFIFIFRLMSVALIAPIGGLLVGGIMFKAWSEMWKK